MSGTHPESVRRPWFIDEWGKPVPLNFLHLSLGTVEDVGELVKKLTQELANSDSYMYICAHADSHKDTLLILGKASQWYKASRTLIKSILEKQFTPLRVTLGIHPLAEQAQALWLEYMAVPTQYQITLFPSGPGPSSRSRVQGDFTRGADGWQDGVGEQTWDNSTFYIEDLREILHLSMKSKACCEEKPPEQRGPDQDLGWAAVQ